MVTATGEKNIPIRQLDVGIEHTRSFGQQVTSFTLMKQVASEF
jgi:hypothetical protein